MKKELRALEDLCAQLEVVQLRVASGQTLSQSLRDMPRADCPRKLAETWVRLRELMQGGRLSVETGLQAFTAQLRLQHELRSKLQEKTLIPKMQFYLILLSALAFALSSFYLYPPELRPSTFLYGLALGLFGGAYLWVRWEFHNFHARLWFSDWLFFLGKVRAQMQWGQTLNAALKESLADGIPSEFPSVLRHNLESFFEKCRQGRPEDFKIKKAPRTHDAELRRAFLELHIFADLERQGQSCGTFIGRSLELSLKSFDQKLSLQSQTLSLRLLLPLFILCVPAFLILIFGPLLQRLTPD